jgi:hypothetical protein
MAAMVRQRWERSSHRCEGCGELVRVVEVAHLFGRRHIVEEPWASAPELCAALCCVASWEYVRFGCHERIDRGLDPELRERLRWIAVERLARAHRLPVPRDADATGAVRALVAQLQES